MRPTAPAHAITRTTLVANVANLLMKPPHAAHLPPGSSGGVRNALTFRTRSQGRGSSLPVQGLATRIECEVA